MKKTSFPTPQDCEAAFYEALEAADLDAMMEVWADDEEIVCVHPGWPRLSGYEQIRGNWAQIFRSGERPHGAPPAPRASGGARGTGSAAQDPALTWGAGATLPCRPTALPGGSPGAIFRRSTRRCLRAAPGCASRASAGRRRTGISSIST